jgi:hypothetical protein
MDIPSIDTERIEVEKINHDQSCSFERGRLCLPTRQPNKSAERTFMVGKINNVAPTENWVGSKGSAMLVNAHSF